MIEIETYYTHRRPEMAALIPEKARRILDVGCGAGEFGASLKLQREIEIVGIELNENAAALASKILDKVVNVPVEKINFMELGGFDCIVLNDVLEHLTDPWEIVKLLTPALKADAKIVASIPNVRSFPVLFGLVWFGRWQYEKEGVLDRTHLRFFTRSSMIEIFESAGLTVESVQGINYHGMPFAMRVLNRICRGKFFDMCFPQIAIVASLNSR
jgi:2-polyprenyl-3-methyl-5-hydroxy-6-metoxy-1,4-benzoquinol methylase